MHIFFVFDRSFNILASEIEVLVFEKKRLEKRLGNKLSFWRSNDNSIFFVMTFLKSRSLKQRYNS